MKRIAIITGASSGLGREFVKILKEKSEIEEIWAIARHQDKLDKLRKQMGRKIRPISMDIADLSRIEELGTMLAKNEIEVQYLINNAGYAKFCSYGDLSVTESVDMINVNISGVVAMGLVCIPYMPRGSHIINIASQAAFQPLPYQNLYSSTKAFVRNYTRALNVELKDRGITATAVCPGWLKTHLYDRANIGAAKATRRFCGMTTPDKVARKAVTDADCGRDISIYSFYVNFCHIGAKLLPQRVMMKLWLCQQRINPCARPKSGNNNSYSRPSQQ
ncbi:MAG: SDR family NAD(P)-dependent oxidoreductase [Lachnospiraceae bacterium]|nr:SDR family NAD(P)-dependent oxidoreductase [Lachnospiraceae bacterium]